MARKTNNILRFTKGFGMIYRIYNRQDDIDTFESSFYPPYTNGRDLVIPYFNVGISNHELNPDENLQYLNCCYLILIDYVIITVDEIINKPKTNADNIQNEPLWLFLGGINIVTNEFEETGYTAREMFLQTNDQLSELSRELWEIKSTDWLNFSSLENMPQNLLDIINDRK